MANFYYNPNANTGGGRGAGAYADLSELTPSKVSNSPYDINYAFQQQSLKSLDGSLRMSLQIPYTGASSGYLTFNAHLDPQKVSVTQGKRLIPLDTLTGVIVQDFGFKAETIEIQGTTGSAYYKEIGQLDSIFNSQSIQGQPTAVSLTIESRTYQCVWNGFEFQRQAGNGEVASIIVYNMSFISLSRGKAGDTSQNLYTSQVAATASLILDTTFTSGNAIVENVSTNGLSPTQYLQGLKTQIPPASLSSALTFVKTFWDTQLNGNKSYPGDNVPLLPNQYLTIPTNWGDVL